MTKPNYSFQEMTKTKTELKIPVKLTLQNVELFALLQTTKTEGKK